MWHGRRAPAGRPGCRDTDWNFRPLRAGPTAEIRLRAEREAGRRLEKMGLKAGRPEKSSSVTSISESRD
jgi:hypothetical protein